MRVCVEFEFEFEFASQTARLLLLQNEFMRTILYTADPIYPSSNRHAPCLSVLSGWVSESGGGGETGGNHSINSNDNNCIKSLTQPYVSRETRRSPEILQQQRRAEA